MSDPRDVPRTKDGPLACQDVRCQDLATRRVAWPGRGWAYYCDAHGRQAIGVLLALATYSVAEVSDEGWLA